MAANYTYRTRQYIMRKRRAKTCYRHST
eukprot:COSAG01_NODE_60993_length_291_cov_2.218750_1_plen_27_part_10